MPRSIRQYRIFIATPGGLSEERQRFRKVVERFSRGFSGSSDVVFEPVGWEETIGGVGRPQAVINEDLKKCDYAVFVLHDRWGTPTEAEYISGFEEEWALAQALYNDNKIRNIAIYFKEVDNAKLADPGNQLKSVLAFKNKIEIEKRYLYKIYGSADEFSDSVESNLI